MKTLLRILAIATLMVVIAPTALLALVILVPITAPLLGAAALLVGGAALALLPLAILALPFFMVYVLCRTLVSAEPAKAI